MSGDSFLKGVELINAKGDTIQGDVAVRDKVVALFFSVRATISGVFVVIY
jgi:hypothetical protein